MTLDAVAVRRDDIDPASRVLGFMETRMHLMHQLFRGSTQGVVALRIRGQLEKDSFVIAARRLVRAHALLRSTISSQGKEYAFQCGESNDAAIRVMTRDADDHWRAVMSAEVECPVDSAHTLFRLTLLHGGNSANAEHDIVLAVHHSIMDGTAVDHFFEQLLTSIAEPENVAPTVWPLPPPAEEVLPRRMRLDWSDYQAQRRAAARCDTFEPPTYARNAPLDERRTRTAFIQVPASALAAIEQRCAAANVSFNAFASAALLAAVRNASPERHRFLLNSTFSLRRLCAGLGRGELGCYMSIIPTYYDFSGRAPLLLDFAFEHQAALSAAILQHARCPSDAPIEDLQQSCATLADARAFLQDVGLTFGESQLCDHYGSLSIMHMYAAVNRSVGTLSAVVHGVKIAGRAFFTVNHTDPLQRQDWANEVALEFTRPFLAS